MVQQGAPVLEEAVVPLGHDEIAAAGLDVQLELPRLGDRETGRRCRHDAHHVLARLHAHRVFPQEGALAIRRGDARRGGVDVRPVEAVAVEKTHLIGVGRAATHYGQAKQQCNGQNQRLFHTAKVCAQSLWRATGLERGGGRGTGPGAVTLYSEGLAKKTAYLRLPPASPRPQCCNVSSTAPTPHQSSTTRP